MVNKKFIVKLSGEARERLREVISRGKAKAKIILKARILLKAVLLIAGPTVNLITNGMLTLLRHPDALELLRRESALMPKAVEELLRFESRCRCYRSAPL